MTARTRIGAGYFLIASVIGASACGAHSPSSVIAPDASAPPSISAIAPASLTTSTAPHAVTIQGASFAPGVMLFVTQPSGGTFSVTGSSIGSVQPASFNATFTTDQSGTYMVVAQNADGSTSTPFSLPVSSSLYARPAIASALPNALSAGPNPFVMTIEGANFLPGLAVTIAGPSSVTIQGQPAVVSSNDVELHVVISHPGDYSMSVLNPDGNLSNTISLTVQ